ncbi:MAG: hypothetical protein WA510_10000, partial [Acidobacteriaceae bacterium]
MNRREFVSKGVTALVLGAHASPAQPYVPSAGETNWQLKSDRVRVSLGPDGTIVAMEVKTTGAWEKVEFCPTPFAGPAWDQVKLESVAGSPANFTATADAIRYSLRYQLEGNRLEIVAGLKNEGKSSYVPKAARLVLGINCEMLSYPAWNERYFPTLLRCEKTHFWGYFMTPRGRILTIGSPDPIASYSMSYEKSSWGDGGHLIRTCNLDLLHALPLPPR